MWPELPTWLTTAVTTAISVGITYRLTRGLNRSTIAEKEANALSTMTTVAANLARQVEAFTAEIPLWRQKLGVETARADLAEKRQNADVTTIYEQAKIIIEEITHFSYIKDPGEPESSVERRFKTIKAAAQRIAACME